MLAMVVVGVGRRKWSPELVFDDVLAIKNIDNRGKKKRERWTLNVQTSIVNTQLKSVKLSFFFFFLLFFSKI